MLKLTPSYALGTPTLFPFWARIPLTANGRFVFSSPGLPKPPSPSDLPQLMV